MGSWRYQPACDVGWMGWQTMQVAEIITRLFLGPQEVSCYDWKLIKWRLRFPSRKEGPSQVSKVLYYDGR